MHSLGFSRKYFYTIQYGMDVERHAILAIGCKFKKDHLYYILKNYGEYIRENVIT